MLELKQSRSSKCDVQMRLWTLLLVCEYLNNPVGFQCTRHHKTLMYTVHHRYKGVRGIDHNTFAAKLWVPRLCCELHLGTFVTVEGAAEVVDQGRIYLVSR